MRELVSDLEVIEPESAPLWGRGFVGTNPAELTHFFEVGFGSGTGHFGHSGLGTAPHSGRENGASGAPH